MNKSVIFHIFVQYNLDIWKIFSFNYGLLYLF